MARTKTQDLWNFTESFEGDKVVWIILILLYLFSIVCMFSSTSRLLDGSMTRIDLVREQIFWVFVGLLIVVTLYNLRNMKCLRLLGILGFPASFFLLLLLNIHINTPIVRTPYINGAYRMLQVGGMQVHVFEVVKVAMMMYLAWAMDSYNTGGILGKGGKKLWKKIAFIYIPSLLIFLMILPGGNSSAVFIGAIMFVVIALGGGNLKDLLLLVLLGATFIGICVGIYESSDGKYMERIGTAKARLSEDNKRWEKMFLASPESSIDYQKALDALRQPYSAKIAIHEGGIFGKGPGQSTQRYMVPDISEDYMFSFIIEEYGIVGALMVIGLFVSLLARGSIIVRNCGKDLFAKLCIAGLCLLISGQAFMHMFVNVDIGITTGQTLPLISHGTSAFLSFSFAFGVILSISRIAFRRIELETKNAQPLMEIKEEMSARIDDLDAFESGNLENYDGI